VAALRIPENLAATAERTGLPEIHDWIAALPRVLTDLTARWDLRVGAPFQPGGQCSWVAPARDTSGRDLVLKVGWSHTESAHEADGLRLWNGDGSVHLHAQRVTPDTTALLLERCVPGSALAGLAAEPRQDVIVAGLLRRLWREPPPGHPFRPLQTMCDEWAAEFEQKLADVPGQLDPGLARDGMELFRALPSTATRAVLLCTDLHAENILAADREPWLVVDPKPYVGDPTYDPLQHMLNCRDRLAQDPHGFARRMAQLLELDAERLTRWLFARCVQESIDAPMLRDVARRLAPA